MINSEHSYERLDWEQEDRAPYYSESIRLRNLESDKLRVIPDDETSETCHGRSKDLVILRPQRDTVVISKRDKNNMSQENITDKTRVPDIVKEHYCNMVNNYNINEKSCFITLMVPPTIKTRVKGNVFKEYGLRPVKHQIRFLRSKIQYLLHKENIEEYIYVFEITKSGLIHCHLICDLDHPSDLQAEYADIIGITRHSQLKVNYVAKQCKSDIWEYVCKIKFI